MTTSPLPNTQPAGQASSDSQADHRIGLLVEAVTSICVAAGVAREGLAASGPEALLLAEDTEAHVRNLVATLDRVEALAESLEEDGDNDNYSKADAARELRDVLRHAGVPVTP